MSDLSFQDSVGILIVFGMMISVKNLAGIAQALVVCVGIVIALPWMLKFVFGGYADVITSGDTVDKD
ncbi:hypothetical protein KM295_16535 [Natronomonas sp. F2-12]|jgi:uncharacterized membrane protein|uniref:Uncharacterized protein n=1 Tax=Natronomonas aquatica TaxID=2841590 RepID=A0A9R1CW66_9EURY|nr:hypothetical protein [Natronomonas aquatica]MCQ4335057.1 hypothetical protein [Natronomonas aquatica]